MVWLPIPRTITRGIRNLFSGSLGWIAWRLFLIAVGAVAISYAVSTGSFFAAFLVGTVLSIALSSTLRGVMLDLWRGRGTKL